MLASPSVTEKAPEVADEEPASTSKPSPGLTVTAEISPVPSKLIQAEPL